MYALKLALADLGIKLYRKMRRLLLKLVREHPAIHSYSLIGSYICTDKEHFYFLDNGLKVACLPYGAIDYPTPTLIIDAVNLHSRFKIRRNFALYTVDENSHGVVQGGDLDLQGGIEQFPLSVKPGNYVTAIHLLNEVMDFDPAEIGYMVDIGRNYVVVDDSRLYLNYSGHVIPLFYGSDIFIPQIMESNDTLHLGANHVSLSTILCNKSEYNEYELFPQSGVETSVSTGHSHSAETAIDANKAYKNAQKRKVQRPVDAMFNIQRPNSSAQIAQKHQLRKPIDSMCQVDRSKASHTVARVTEKSSPSRSEFSTYHELTSVRR